MARIFVSYSHRDRRWVDPAEARNLVPFLADSLRREGVEIWYDHALAPGDEFRAVIEERIDAADMVLLLVSQDFLNSDFIGDVELPRIERRAAGGLVVIPILVGHCDWQELRLVGERQLLPGGPRPLIEFVERDADWTRVRHEILQAVRKRVARLPGQPGPAESVRPGQPAAPAVAPVTSRRAAGGRWRIALGLAAAVALALVLAAVFVLRPGAGGREGGEPVGATAPVGAAELDALAERLSTYQRQIRSLPFGAAALRPQLETAAERLWSGRAQGPEAARVAGTAYRLYAAAILLSPTGSSLEGFTAASPWVRRAADTYPDFADRAELDAANRFFLEVALRRSAELDMRTLLGHELRVAMIEASQTEVDEQVEVALDTIKSLIQRKEGGA